MAKPTYEVIKCTLGHEALQDALNKMAEDVEVISVLPNHGDGGWAQTISGGASTFGYLIVVRRKT